MKPFTGQSDFSQLKLETKRIHHKSKDGEKGNYKTRCHSIFTFDIEVTSAWIDEKGKVIPYRKGESAEYWNSLQPLALCYIWQFSCDGEVYYGRELTEFIKVLDALPKDAECIIWVHNLAYEFQFLCNILTWKNVFARTAHKPMKCVSNEYPNIEFRCSYFLTRLSLAVWGEQVGIAKLVGDLDYEKLRTPLTPLTEQELAYCEHDCLIVEAGIKSYVKRYGTQFDIPLTQTGTVRLECKNRLMSDIKYSYAIKKLVPKDAKQYKMLMNIFAGGYTHANYWYSGIPLFGTIQHYDFASSYPTVMIAEKYPMTPWVYCAIHDEMPSMESFEDNAYIFQLHFSQLKSISCNTYIQASKCKGTGLKYDNGRVMQAEDLEIWITEQDYITIQNNYVWDKMEILSMYESKKQYLPKTFVDYILELYGNKTKLKGVEGEEELYMQSKQYINSLYGMSVTAIVQASIKLEGDEWITEELTEDYVNRKLNNLRFPNPREKKYFLSYSWGCWVTAYARRNLWKCIEACDDEMIYCDTDSIFVLGEHDFSWYNKEIVNKLKKACKAHKIDFELTHPKTPKGKEKQLGVFEREDDCSEFITLGAKRYVERRVSDNKLHLTVSGINKGAVELLNDDIENFADGFNFDKDADCVTKRLSTYINDMPMVTYPDGYVSAYTHGINLRRNGYLLTMTDEYKELIQYMEMTVDDLSDEFKNNTRGYFDTF